MRIVKALTRRDFLKGTAGIALASAFGPGLPSTAQAQTKSTVILIRDAQVVGSGGEINGKILRSMLDQAVSMLANEKEPLEGWKTFFKKSDIIGINFHRY